MNPILISSPVRRSGTTLVQRLLTSARNTLIYGESCANDLVMFSNLIQYKEMYFNASKTWRNDQLRRVLDGQLNHWIPDLMPDIDEYLNAFKSSVLDLFKFYRDAANDSGNTIWGTKLPQWDVNNLNFIRQLLPESKIIYIIRDIHDCLRSAKAIHMIQGEEGTLQFCQIWKHNKEYALQHFNGDNILHLTYEELINDPEQACNQIERFTGANGIDVSILSHKVNTYADDSNQDGYVQPVELSDADLELIQRLN